MISKVLIFSVLLIYSNGHIDELETDDVTEINWLHCGERPLEHEYFPHKIVGGQESLKGDWPWQIALNYNGRFICGGSIINSLWIITAAHCVNSNLNPTNYKITAGLHDLTVHDKFTDVRSTSKIIVHPAYSNFGYKNDIALIKLDQKLIFSNYIMPACLPDLSFNLTNQDGIATGWGSLLSGGALSRYLMEVQLPILNDTRCKDKFNGVETTTVICAGDYNLNLDTCQGDSGGPLVVSYEGHDHEHDHDHDHDHDHEHEHEHEHHVAYFLVGITSWGYGCGDGGVYTRTSAFVSWISQTIKNN
ncbi:Serine ase stubble [Brachionus plicatilis]|uniref:Acrosin n=1 Tax=Brachionus plicatilis TaxID=10195 RepID=A0A3M7PLF8_BRAPC|nr:Serine ase stubble [Brachionus plicatilis]